MVRLSTPGCCEVFKVSKVTLGRWKKLGAKVAYLDRGAWDLGLLMDWWLQNIYQGSGPDSETLTAARERYWAAKADRERLKADQEARDLVPKSEIAPQWAARILEVGTGLYNLADRLPPLLEAKDRREMAGIIRAEVRRLQINYSRNGRFCVPPEGQEVPE